MTKKSHEHYENELLQCQQEQRRLMQPQGVMSETQVAEFDDGCRQLTCRAHPLAGRTMPTEMPAGCDMPSLCSRRIYSSKVTADIGVSVVVKSVNGHATPTSPQREIIKRRPAMIFEQQSRLCKAQQPVLSGISSPVRRVGGIIVLK